MKAVFIRNRHTASDCSIESRELDNWTDVMIQAKRFGWAGDVEPAEGLGFEFRSDEQGGSGCHTEAGQTLWTLRIRS